MHIVKITIISIFIIIISLSCQEKQESTTIAFWSFDEQQGIYPSCVLTDLSENDYPLVLGPGGQIVDGKFGNALDAIEQPAVQISEDTSKSNFGLARLPVPEGRTQEPLSWFNANFTALMTSGEKHLRNQVGFPQVTTTQLNLGDFDWTIEFWFKPLRPSDDYGVVFEIGSGPRAENDTITALRLNADQTKFILTNHGQGVLLSIPTKLLNNSWQHLAFVYDSGSNQLIHYVAGKAQALPDQYEIRKLPVGPEDYMTLARDGKWKHPLQGSIDELRFSTAMRYKNDFDPPASFSYLHSMKRDTDLLKGPELLFDRAASPDIPIKLNDRKHLFIDDAMLDKNDGADFVVNPPRPAEIVMTNMEGAFRKHLSVIEDDNGQIRLYTTVDDDYLAVWISADGIHFNAPVLKNGQYKGNNNIVLHSKVGMGIVFKDPNAPPAERWKYISDYHRRAVSLFYSSDGLEFKRYKQPVLPFRSGSQCNIYYDDQKQVYTAFHRSDFGRTKTGDTQRDFVMTETADLLTPWPFKALSQDEAEARAAKMRTADLIPWYLDNGPLTPGGFSVEYPWIFSPVNDFDPRETDIYVPKAMKYPWAPDTYLSFPILYFHYEESEPVTRAALMDPNRQRGSGPLETQVAVSRNGVDWKRYPRPVYVGIGEHAGIDFKTSYIAHGMIKRGDEIWQYNFSEPHYHSPWIKYPKKRAVYRLVQRLDGFVSLDSPYEREAQVVTKPFVFKGNKLVLNVDTDATGYIQVGFLDDKNQPVPGYSVDDCIYINGDFIETNVEWMQNRNEIERISNEDEEDPETLSKKVKTTVDVSSLAGRTVKLIFRMRGSKLYAMQFQE